MVKEKRKSIIFYVVIVIIILALFAAGFLIYNSLKGKSQIPLEGDEESEEITEELPPIGEEIGIFSKIKNIFGGSGGGGSGGGGGGADGGAGGGAGGEAPTYISEQTICQNAQNDNLCDGLDITYGEGYRTLCCSEHNLCC